MECPHPTPPCPSAAPTQDAKVASFSAMSGVQIVKPKVQVARTAVTCVAVAASAYVETRAIGREYDSHVSHQSLRGWYTMFPTLCTEPRRPSQAQSASAFYCRSCVSPLHPYSYLPYVNSHPFPLVPCLASISLPPFAANG